MANEQENRNMQREFQYGGGYSCADFLRAFVKYTRGDQKKIKFAQTWVGT